MLLYFVLYGFQCAVCNFAEAYSGHSVTVKTPAHDRTPATRVASVPSSGVDYRPLRLSNTWHDGTITKALKDEL